MFLIFNTTFQSVSSHWIIVDGLSGARRTRSRAPKPNIYYIFISTCTVKCAVRAHFAAAVKSIPFITRYDL